MSAARSRILSITSGRSDVSILRPVWHALVASGRFELSILATGTHVEGDHELPAGAVPDGAIVTRGGASLGGLDGASAGVAMAEIMRAAAAAIAKDQPRALLLIGDRLDMLPAAVAAMPSNVPIVHLHGGEVTLGAVDDRIRHAVSKLAHLHCVSSAPAAGRLAAMGEEAWRIAITGAPGLDTLASAPVLSARAFAEAAGLPSLDGLRLVTVHPETNAAEPARPLLAVLDALDQRPAPTLLTATNADPGGAAMQRQIEAFAASRPFARLVPSLGPALYRSALEHARVMVGNSSSGIVEAGFVGLPVIDVGDRQAGRDRGPNVRHAGNEAGDIVQLLDSLPPRGPAGRSLYGDGRAAPRIVAHIARGLAAPELLLKQPCSEGPRMPAPWDKAGAGA